LSVAIPVKSRCPFVVVVISRLGEVLMKFFGKCFGRLLGLSFVFLILMSLWRGIFFFYYSKGVDFSGFQSDIAFAFFMGLRFDLSVIASINILPILFFILIFLSGRPSIVKPFFAALKVYYTIAISLLFLLLAIDFGFYSFFQDHINTLIFAFFEDDTSALISTIYTNYNVFVILAGFIIFVIFIFKLSKKFLKTPPTTIAPKYFLRRLLISLIILLLTFIAMRGTIGDFPLAANTGVSQNRFINILAINAPFTLQSAIESRLRDNADPDYIVLTGYKDNIRQAFADYLDTDIKNIPIENPQDSLITSIAYNEKIENLKPNVIFIVAESLGTDLMRYNSPDFNVLGELKKHFDDDFIFYNFVPGYFTTVGSMEAVISNLARRPGSTFLSLSPYVYNSYDFSGPVPFKKKGFETFFIYGGNSGWRNAYTFMTNLGFDKIIGSDGMKDKKYDANEWGVYDEHLLDYVFETLASNDKQKFIYVLTTTNHPPYTLPKNYKSLPLIIPQNLKNKIIGKDLADKRFLAYQYAAQALAEFISQVKNSKYGDNTIIAITGDHNFKGIYSYGDDEIFNSFRVPFYLYIPAKLRPKIVDTKVFGSHLDIMPTLYHLSLSDIKYRAMGINLLSPKAKNNIVSHVEIIMDKTYLINFSFEHSADFYVWDKTNPDLIIETDESAANKKLIKHFLSMTAVSHYLLKQTGKPADVPALKK
jgi:phosphoglycerol transferase MdoB-like AlkP superfamily enzyme